MWGIDVTTRPNQQARDFQCVSTPHKQPFDRADHVWYRYTGLHPTAQWKCCTCGALAIVPPPYPTPKEYYPIDYELPLTAEEKGMAPVGPAPAFG